MVTTAMSSPLAHAVPVLVVVPARCRHPSAREPHQDVWYIMATRLLVGPVCASSGNASRAAWARVFHVERRASSMVCHRTAPSEIQDAPRTLSTSGEVPKFSTGSHSALAGTCVVAWTRDMRKITIIGIVLILLAPAPAGAQQVSSDDNRWTWPLRGRALTTTITAGFDPPSSRFGAGHRGIDLAGTSGDDVLAVASGVVSYVGVIDGVPNVVVDHGRQRSTYQPVSADVRQGERVRAGAVLGTLVTSGSHCARSEERRVGKEWRGGWGQEEGRTKREGEERWRWV